MQFLRTILVRVCSWLERKKYLLSFRFHFPLGNPALSSTSLTAPGAVGFKQVTDEFRSFKSKSLSKAPGVTLEEFGQILKVRNEDRL